jgi:hypothetical protein
LPEGPGPTSSSGSLPALRVARRCSPVGFDRQQDLTWVFAKLSLYITSKDFFLINRNGKSFALFQKKKFCSVGSLQLQATCMQIQHAR